jgi:putative SOS response-associated peptidase YedK
MCGRYALYGPVKRKRVEDRWFDDLAGFGSRYNIAPTEAAPVMRLVDGKPVVALLRWGLIPYWAKDPAMGGRLINARADTLAEKPAFRDACRARRCLVPARGFYEWKKVPGGKQPWYVTSADGTMLAFAGLWERWRPAGGEPLLSFTIVTTDATEPIKEIHGRMPAIIEPAEFDAWLHGEDPPALMRPCPPENLIAYRVSTAVNRAGADDPALIEPLPER